MPLCTSMPMTQFMTHIFDIQFEFDNLFKYLTASINSFSFHTAFGFAVVFFEVFLLALYNFNNDVYRIEIAVIAVEPGIIYSFVKKGMRKG